MAKGKTFALVCRQSLFRKQVIRLQCIEHRRPNLTEARRMWSETGFKTA